MTTDQLEIAIDRREVDAYRVEMRFTSPDQSETDMLAVGRPVRFDLADLNAALDDPARYGRLLTDSLFERPELRTTFGKSRTLAAEHDRPLQVRLYVEPSSPELHGLRWETLLDPDTGAGIVTQETVLFSRYLGCAEWKRVQLRPRGDIKALVMVAGPADLERYPVDGRPLAKVDVAAEAELLRSALATIPVTELTGTGAATLDALRERIRAENDDILCVVCHGALIDGRPVLYLEDAAGNTAPVTGQEFVDRLVEVGAAPRLVVLASCQSAGTGSEAGTADGGTMAALGPLLAEHGFPAVVAMQGNVSTVTARLFLEEFFKVLRDPKGGGQIDRAMTALADRVAGLAFHPDGTRLAAAAAGGGVFVWDWNEGWQAPTVPARDPVAAPAGAPGSAGPGTGRTDGGISCLAYCPAWADGSAPAGRKGEPVLVAGGGTVDRGTLTAWSTSPAREPGWTGRVLRWAVPSGEWANPTTLNAPHPAPVRGLAFSGDGSLMATACRDARVRVWARTTRAWVDPYLLYDNAGHEMIATGVAFFPGDGCEVLASGSDDKTVRLWAVRASPALAAHAAPYFGANAEAFDRQLRYQASAESTAPPGSSPAPHRAVRVRDLATGRVVFEDTPGGAGTGLANAGVGVRPGDGRAVVAGPGGVFQEPGDYRPWTVPGPATIRPGSVGFTPNGDRSVAAYGKSVAVHDRAGSELAQFELPQPAEAVALSADGEQVLALLGPGPWHVHVRDLGGNFVSVHAFPSPYVSRAAAPVSFAPGGRLVAVVSSRPGQPAGQVSVFKLAPDQPITNPVWEESRTDPHPALPVLAAGADLRLPVLHTAFSADGRYFAFLRGNAGSATVQVLDTASWRPVLTLRDFRPPPADAPRWYAHPVPTRVAVHADPLRVAVGFSRPADVKDGSVWVWKRDDGQEPTKLGAVARHTGPVAALAFGPGGGRVVSTGADGTVIDSGVDPGADETVPVRGVLPVADLVFSGDGRALFTADDGGTVRRWQLDGDRFRESPKDGIAGLLPLARVYQPRPVRNNWIDASHDGRVVATLAFDDSVEVTRFDAAGRVARRVVVPPPDVESTSLRALAVSGDGALVATAASDGGVRLYDVSGAAAVARDGGRFRHGNQVNYVTVSRDGPLRLASTGDDRTVRVWDPAAPAAPPVELHGHTQNVTWVVFNQSGTRLASVGLDGTFRVWALTADDPDPNGLGRVRPGSQLFSVIPTGQTVVNIEFGPDSRLVASTRRTTANGQLRQVQVYEFDRDRLLTAAGTRFLPMDIDDRRQRFIENVDPALAVTPAR